MSMQLNFFFFFFDSRWPPGIQSMSGPILIPSQATWKPVPQASHQKVGALDTCFSLTFLPYEQGFWAVFTSVCSNMSPSSSLFSVVSRHLGSSRSSQYSEPWEGSQCFRQHPPPKSQNIRHIVRSLLFSSLGRRQSHFSLDHIALCQKEELWWECAADFPAGFSVAAFKPIPATATI